MNLILKRKVELHQIYDTINIDISKYPKLKGMTEEEVISHLNKDSKFLKLITKNGKIIRNLEAKEKSELILTKK